MKELENLTELLMRCLFHRPWILDTSDDLCLAFIKGRELANKIGGSSSEKKQTNS